LLAQVLREATTNLLRHAHPRTVCITASATRVEITNDGLITDAGPEPELRGLARLQHRLDAVGGGLHVTTTPATFTVIARLRGPVTCVRATAVTRPAGAGPDDQR
jgi:two-component system sensor histidine kinase DesK